MVVRRWSVAMVLGVLVLGLSPGSGLAQAEEPQTAQAVSDAITEYVRSKYAGDDEAVRSRAHHDIARRRVVSTLGGAASVDWVMPYNHDQMRVYGTVANSVLHDDPEDGRLEIEVYDVRGDLASASVLMDDVYDLVHLVRLEGRWLIADSAVILLGEHGRPAPAQTRDDRDAVYDVVAAYCRGFYARDAQAVREVCHTILSRRTLRHREALGYSYLQLDTHELVGLLASSYRPSDRFEPDLGRVEIEVFHAGATMAACKLNAETWMGYLQLLKVNGQWKIVNTLYLELEAEQWGEASGVEES